MSDIHTTDWTATVSGTSATLQVAVDGGQPHDFAIKGVCYSPCPVNGSNAHGPALGDWFWDSFSGPGYSVGDWESLWARDLPNLKAMGVNTLRVYNMLSRQLRQNGTFPDPWDEGHCFTHTHFLDRCLQEEIYVIVGIALPQKLFSLDQSRPPVEVAFWENVLRETAAQVGSHPAVLGFSFMNELDSSAVTYPNSDRTNLPAVAYWWRQVEKMAEIIKNAAPGKLTGIAVHDDPNICGGAQEYMASCPHVDFWGVNTYQMESLNTVFGATPQGPGYAGIGGPAHKPVVLTEWGVPATTRTDPHDRRTICQTGESIANAARPIYGIVPQAFSNPICIGLCYFEYSDEWWSQGAPDDYTWYGGDTAAGFPNGYWDQEGFGLYQTIPGAGAGGGPIWDGQNNKPALPVDTMNEREATVTALARVFAPTAMNY